MKKEVNIDDQEIENLYYSKLAMENKIKDDLGDKAWEPKCFVFYGKTLYFVYNLYEEDIFEKIKMTDVSYKDQLL